MSSQLGSKAAPGQHSAHILLGFILREHQSTSANFLGKVGEGRGGGFLFPHLAAMRHALGCLCVLRKLQRESVLFLREARHGRLPGKACELATQIQLCVAIFFDFASRVLGIGPQAALDRVRPDDSIFLLVSVLGRFDK